MNNKFVVTCLYVALFSMSLSTSELIFAASSERCATVLEYTHATCLLFHLSYFVALCVYKSALSKGVQMAHCTLETMFSYCINTVFSTYKNVSNRNCGLVAAFNGGRSPSSGFVNYPQPQLPASHSDCSQQLNRSTSLTNSPTDLLTPLTNSTDLLLRVRVRVTLRLAVYRHSVRFGVKPLEAHDQTFSCSQLKPCGHSPYVTSPLSLVNRLRLCQVYVSHIQHVIENSSLCII
jgi:hypothetical protein